YMTTYSNGYYYFSGGDDWVSSTATGKSTRASGTRIDFEALFGWNTRYDQGVYAWAASSIVDELGKGVSITYREDGLHPLVDTINYDNVAIKFHYVEQRKVRKQFGSYAAEMNWGDGSAAPVLELVGGQLLDRVETKIGEETVRVLYFGY